MRKSDKVSGIIVYSVIGAIFFAILGLVLGLISGSTMILFDGMYSIVSLLLGLLSLYVSKFISKPNYENFPFGKYVFQPLMVLLSSSVLMVLGLIGIINSVSDILNGGRPTDTGIGLIYGFITFIGCGLIAYVLFKNKDKSELIKSEFVQWFMDTLLSFGIIIGFAFVIIFQNTPLDWLANYIDPLMVVFAGIFILYLASRLFISNLREVLTLPPHQSIQQDITEITLELNKEYNVEDQRLHVSKMGPVLYIDLVNYIEDDSLVSNIDSIDYYSKIYRDKLLETYKDELWLNVVFT